ncbi:MAG: SRPBCC family protein [Pseudomonadales bacterium]
MTNEVSYEISIDIPREEAWEKLRDISLAHNYVPGLVSTEIRTEQKEGVGASRRVFQKKDWIDETVEEWTDGYGFLIRLHRGDKTPPVFNKAWFRYSIADGPNDTTIFNASMTYEMPWGGIGRALDKYVLRKSLVSILRDVAVAMKSYYETGEPVTPDKLKALKAKK